LNFGQTITALVNQRIVTSVYRHNPTESWHNSTGMNFLEVKLPFSTTFGYFRFWKNISLSKIVLDSEK
jgi:hypothetical protein